MFDSTTMRCAIMLTLCFGASACVSFKPSALAYAKNQQISAALLNHSEPRYSGTARLILEQYSSPPINLRRAGDDNTQSQAPTRSLRDAIGAFKQACDQDVAPQTDGGLVPLVAAAAKLGFDIYSDRVKKKLEAIKKASSASYGTDFVLEAGLLESYGCLVLIRHDRPTASRPFPEINAILALQISAERGVLMLKPDFFWARNTVAATRKVKGDEKEAISFLAGVSLQGIGHQENGLEILAATGQDAEKLGQVVLGAENVAQAADDTFIGPVPLVEGKSPVVVLRISATEVGDVGFNIDERLALNKTLKEAIGPALSKGVEAYLKDE